METSIKLYSHVLFALIPLETGKVISYNISLYIYLSTFINFLYTVIDNLSLYQG